MSRFRFVSDHRSEYPIKRLCELAEVVAIGLLRLVVAATVEPDRRGRAPGQFGP